MHWKFIMTRVLKFVVFGVGVIGAAFFYRSPVTMDNEAQNAIAGARIWHMEIVGEVQKEQLHVDIVKRPEQGFLRVSYPPLKLINNQWIALEHNSPLPPLTLRGGVNNSPPLKVRGGAGGVMSYDVFNYLRLTRRLTTLREIFARRERYGFVFDGNMQEAFLGMLPEGGELLMDARSGLPLELRAAQLRASISYNDPLEDQSVHTRPLDDVLAQLTEVAQAQNGKPRKIMPLTQNSGDVSVFTKDFDRDGLSDALEIFYGTDMANPDTDNDAFLDGEEVERGFSPRDEGRLN